MAVLRLPAPENPCPCGRPDPARRGQTRAWARCCGLWIETGMPAPDAESLMRSRYAAYVVGATDHLLVTWHPTTRPGSLTWEPHLRWLGLEVRSHRMTGVDAAEVEFVARSRDAGRAHRLHERSRFVREAGNWFYLDGAWL